MAIADLTAKTSGFDSNLIGTGGGCGITVWSGCECVYVCLAGGACRGMLSTAFGARRGPKTGVMGEKGGCSGEADRDFVESFGS